MVRITIHGPCLAGLLQAACIGTPTEGLLFGTAWSQTVSAAADDTEEVQTVQEELDILEFVTTLTPGSLFNSVGDIIDTALEAARRCSELQLIGWFSFAPATATTPSLREKAATASLAPRTGPAAGQQHPGPQHPTVFLKLTQGQLHVGATIRITYKCYLRGPGAGPLQAVELQVPNMNMGLGGQEYSGLPLNTGMATGGGPGEKALLQAVAGAEGAAAALQRAFAGVVEEMGGLVEGLEGQHGEVQQLLRQRQELLQRLRALS